MASTYVNDLRLNELATGDGAGTWGTTTNTNLELIGEAFSYGTEAITTNADTHATTIADGATDPGRSMYLKYTGTLDSACTITIGPNTISKMWFIENATTGSQNIIISQGSGANITIPPGDTKAVYSDGAGSGAAFFDAFASINVGALAGTSLDISGDIDVDGTTNLDIVDIDGAVNMATTALVTGVLTTTAATVFNGGFASNADSTLGTDKKVQFRDSAIYINSSADGQLDIVADTEIQIAATTIDINGAINASGEIIAASLDISGDIDVDGTTNLDIVDIDGAVDMASTLTVTGEITANGGIALGDSDKATFGAGDDLQIYHTGTSSVITDTGTGDLKIRANNLLLEAYATEDDYLTAIDGGAVTIFYDGSPKLATTSTGIDVTGTATMDGLTVDGTGSILLTATSGDSVSWDSSSSTDLKTTAILEGQANANLVLSADSSRNSYLWSNYVNTDLILGKRSYVNGANRNTNALKIASNGDISFYNTAGTSQALFWDASATSLGIGTTSPTSLLTLGTDTFSAAATNTSALYTSTTDGMVALADGYTWNTRGGIERMKIDSSGKVGIGTSSPATLLNIASIAAPTLRIENTDITLADGQVIGAVEFYKADSSGAGAGVIGGMQMLSSNSTGAETSLTFGTSKTADGNNIERMRIDSSGKVGIGTASPSDELTIRGAQFATTTLSIGDNSDRFRIGYLHASGLSSGLAAAQLGSDAYSDLLIAAPSNAASEIKLFTNASSGAPSERMRIDNSGNLLVGTTATTPWTNSTGTSADNGIALREDGILGVSAYKSTAGAGNVAYINRTNSDGGILAFSKDGTAVGSIKTFGSELYIESAGNKSGFRLQADAILPRKNEASSNGTIDLGNASNRFKDLYLSGNATHGTTPSSSASGVFTEAVGRTKYSRGSGTGGFGHLLFINGNGTVGSVTTSGSATAYNTSSDYRLKENVVAMSDATERLKQLKPSRFNFIADADTTVDGFLAHEVQDIVPEAITGTKDAMMDEEYEVTPAVLDDDGNVVTEAVMGTRSVPDYQGIDQSKLVPLLVKTIQELESRITALES